MFVAINYISCADHYRERFEELFKTRARAIDRMPGFIRVEILRPTDKDGHYLIMSHWEAEQNFKDWAKSPEFLEGHKRALAEIKEMKDRGEESPLKSDFKTYEVFAT